MEQGAGGDVKGKPFIVVFVGPPGCGKATQADVISQHYSFLREPVSAHSPTSGGSPVDGEPFLSYEALDRSIREAAESGAKGLVLQNVFPDMVPFVEQTCAHRGLKVNCLVLFEADDLAELYLRLHKKRLRRGGPYMRNASAVMLGYALAEPALVARSGGTAGFFRVSAEAPRAEVTMQLLEIIG
eukprot:RCo038583